MLDVREWIYKELKQMAIELQEDNLIYLDEAKERALDALDMQEEQYEKQIKELEAENQKLRDGWMESFCELIRTKNYIQCEKCKLGIDEYCITVKEIVNGTVL